MRTHKRTILEENCVSFVCNETFIASEQANCQFLTIYAFLLLLNHNKERHTNNFCPEENQISSGQTNSKFVAMPRHFLPNAI